MYKVFIENKAIIFKKGFSNSPELFQQYGPRLKKSKFKDFSMNLNKREHSLIIYSEHPKETFQKFFEHFDFLEAAGGIVRSTQQPVRYLFIKRWEKWDLPKGKLEKGESPEVGAKREIHEECNMHNLQLILDLPCTYHAYFMYKKYILKKTHWFLFEGSSDQQLIPQRDEDITEVKWFTKDEFSIIKANTYTSLLDLFLKIE